MAKTVSEQDSRTLVRRSYRLRWAAGSVFLGIFLIVDHEHLHVIHRLFGIHSGLVAFFIVLAIVAGFIAGFRRG